MRVLHAVTVAADALVRRHGDVVEAIDGMVIAERVTERRRAHELDARHVLVDEEQRVLAGMRTVRELRLQDEVVGVVRARDVPLFAGDAGSRPRAASRTVSMSTSDPEPLSVIA